MRRSNPYQPAEQFKDYTLSSPKRFKSHMYYQEKVVTLSQRIYKKLKTLSELLESLYPSLTHDAHKNIKAAIKKNVEILIVDLGEMQKDLDNNPSNFNTKDLKTNQNCINDMKSVCDNLQTVSTFEHEFKKLGKIKHVLTELEHLLEPTMYEKNYQEAKMKSALKSAPAKTAKKKAAKPKKVSATKAKTAFKRALPKKSATKRRAKSTKASSTKAKAKKTTSKKTK
jgi:hypothetical protein